MKSVLENMESLVKSALSMDEPLEIEASLVVRTHGGDRHEFFRTAAEVIDGLVVLRELRTRHEQDVLNRTEEAA